jgi:hypothetical protein
MTAKPTADAMRQMHPSRLRFAMFSDQNPMMQPIRAMAEAVRAAREPVAPDNPLLAVEKAISSGITTCLEAYGNARDAMTEALFLNAYGSPLLQAMVGLGPQVPPSRQRIERDLIREADEARLRSELEMRFEVGGLVEAALRSLIYVSLPEGSVDERGFAMLKAIRAEQPAEKRLTMGQLKELLKEQFLLVRLDEERAIKAIPKLLPKSVDQRRAALDALHRMVTAKGTLPEEGRRRLNRIEVLFDVKAEKPAKGEAVNA